jgi:formylglycine-generating enzyme
MSDHPGQAVITLPGGEFQMGSNAHYPEERPQRIQRVAPFRLCTTPVTNAQFAVFVQATAYVTVAERRGFSHVFQMTAGPVPLNNPDLWWKAVAGACWHNPRPGFELPADFDRHPVVHVALEDAKAYACWAGGRLPTEAEWEYAAWGGPAGNQGGAQYAWGDEFAPAGQRVAHVWQGAFPWYHATADAQTRPPAPLAVGSFAANPLGIYDMIGNVWEWTATLFTDISSCCSCSPMQDDNSLFALKGGSYLCAAEYCQRYRPPARIGLAGSSTTSHAGFRCAHDCG